MDYLRACSYTFTALFVGFYCGMYALQAWGGFWLSDWSDMYLVANVTEADINKDNRILVYAMIGLGQRKCFIVLYAFIRALFCKFYSEIIQTRALFWPSSFR
jgi:hypothetical protein